VSVALSLALAAAGSGCASVPAGVPGAKGRAVAERILEQNLQTADATLVGRFILEAERGQSRGSIRVRYLRPDVYRVDAFLSGAAGAGGGTSFLVEGDSTYAYADSEGGAGSLAIERGSVVPFLEDFDLELEDLKSLAIPAPYLGGLDLGRTRYSYVRGGVLLQGHISNGDNVSIWIDDEKEVVTRALRLDVAGLPLVETKLSRFKRVEGAWRASRISVKHFGQNASLSVQYDRISINEGLRRDDLLIKGMS
jgi:hypothetical protein